MFEQIELITTIADHRISSRFLDEETKHNKKYGEGNLPNSNFSILGAIDEFKLPPISDVALTQLNYVQSFSRIRYEAPSFTERQNYESYLIAYTYEGTGTLKFRDKTYTLLPKDGFFIDCREYHLYEATKGTWEVGVLHASGPLFSKIYEQFISTGSPVFHESFDGKYQHYLEKILKLYSNPQIYRDWQVSSAMDSMLTHLLLVHSIGYTEKTEIPTGIADVVRYMERNYTEKLSLDLLAEKAHINKYHLSREFKKYTGFSPNDYLISLRINSAKDLLSSTTIPACKIAYQVGIRDINNFNALFKKRVGVTPIQYRQANQI